MPEARHNFTNSRARVAGFFSRQAGRFPIVDDRRRGWGGRCVDAFFRRSLRLRFERVLTGCAPVSGKTILDVGCGPGTYSTALASRGARCVVGIDVASEMIKLARNRAKDAGIEERCEFRVADLAEFHYDEVFDFVIVMGVMDYVEDARPFVTKVLSLTRQAAFFSFPKRNGFLAWQRRLRYRRRCPLFMYSREALETLFQDVAGQNHKIESLARDWLVTVRRHDP